MPRMGIGMPIVSETSEAAVLAVQDFVFLNDVSGELTPVDTSSRTNKLVQSQTFKTSWATNNAAIPNDLFEAPDNSLTAQAITASSAGASSVLLQQVVATTAGETYTYSVHAKKDSAGFVSLQFGDGTTTRKAWFNLSTGAATNTSNILTSSFDKMDDNWFRVSITFQADATTSSSFVRIFAASVAGSTSTGVAFQAGTELIYVWGAQLEEDSRPSSYIVTTNAAVNVATTLNDLSEMFDFDGTDIMLEASLDKNEGAFEEATANLVTNGDFAADSNWTKGTGWSISDGKARYDASSGSSFTFLGQGSLFPGAGDYEITFTLGDLGGSFAYNHAGIVVNGIVNSFQGFGISSAGTHTVRPSLNGSNLNLNFYGHTSGGDFSIDNVSVKEYAIIPLDV